MRKVLADEDVITFHLHVIFTGILVQIHQAGRCGKLKEKNTVMQSTIQPKKTNLQLWIVISIAVTLMSEYRIHDSVLIFSSTQNTYTKAQMQGFCPTKRSGTSEKGSSQPLSPPG